jgi:integrative and conjugative element protein (TIGR02256 family)|tara:strand:- start:273 stop:2030 length:1758 start_codon:yes stop_codon:yes gene_type:complete
MGKKKKIKKKHSPKSQPRTKTLTSSLIVPKVLITPNVQETIQNECCLTGQFETGGLLLGERKKVSGRYTLIIRVATGPGDLAVHGYDYFIPDVDHYKKELRFFLYQHGLVYLGEWHKHPGMFNSPSCTDMDTMREIVNGDESEDLIVGIATTFSFNGSDDLGKTVNTDFYYFNAGMKGFRKFVPSTLAKRQKVKKRKTVKSINMDLGYVIELLTSGEKYLSLEGVISNEGVLNIFKNIERGKKLSIDIIFPNDDNEEISIPESTAEVLITVYRNSVDFDARAWQIDCKDGQMVEIPLNLSDFRKEIFKRLNGLNIQESLQLKKVCLIGVGSVGSTAALQMAKSGVEDLVLIDPDELKMHNIIRHSCDIRDLGRKKVSAVAEKLQYINPDVSVKKFATGFIEEFEEIKKEVLTSDLLIVSTDTPDSRRFANMIAVEHGIPTVFISLYERARTGSVQRVIPGVTACRACLGDPKAEFIPGTLDYTDASERDILFQPGLDTDISLVTMLGVKIALSTLLNPTAAVCHEFNSNYLYWNGYPKSGEPNLLFVPETGIKRNEQCEICSSKQIENNDSTGTKEKERKTEETE